ESKNALVRIPVAGKVCAYALDPHEVWKGYNTTKNHAAQRNALWGCRGEALTQSRSDSGVYTGLLLCKPRQP
nr:hypothetical protein [Escherichia coli]